MLNRIVHLWVLGFLAGSMMGADPEKSVIQISTFSQQPFWDAPWRSDSVRRASGSGFVIRGKRIMTNAHVVSWARQLLVRRYQDPRPWLARVAFIAHDCDLALLEVEDEAFFDGLEPLDFGELPKVRSTVVTYGYPAGGEQISYTRGVVSRIEAQPFVHIGNRALLAVQTDAAINPGNSGGPVIQEDKVVGVAFQGMAGLENTGFFISPSLIQHFLKDIEDGTYHGFPQAGIGLVALQNPAYRRYLQLPDNDQGARIDSIYPVPSTLKVLQVEDVLLQAGSYPVGSDGTILYQGNRVNVSVAFSDAQAGEMLDVKVWRQGKALDLKLPMTVIHDDGPQGNQYAPPKYFIYGGLVFTPLNRDYLKTLGANAGEGASGDLFYELYYRRQESPEKWRPEPVVLATVLSHPVNANVSVRGRALVDKINGLRIEKMADVIKAFEKADTGFDAIEFVSQHTMECLEHKAVQQANEAILKTYNVPQDRRL